MADIPAAEVYLLNNNKTNPGQITGSILKVKRNRNLSGVLLEEK